MDIDERRCPNCGRDILSWDVTCPGCDQTPWETPAARRVIRARRRWHALMTGGPIAALLLLVAVVIVVGNLHLSKTVAWSRRQGGLARAVAQAESLATMLRAAASGSSHHNALLASGRSWLERELPTLLSAAGDTKLPAPVRATVVQAVAGLFDDSHPLAPLVLADHRAQAIDALMPLLSEPDGGLRRAARAALAAMGAGGVPASTDRDTPTG